MEERKPFTLIMTDDAIVQAIRAGHNTSTKIAKVLRVHKVSIRGKLTDMYNLGLIQREQIGQTYVYGVMEE